VETFLFGGRKQSIAQDFLGRVLGQFEVVDARIDRGIATVCRVNLADDGQSRLKVGKSAGWQRRAASCKLQERFALISAHSNQYINQPLEAGTTHTNNAAIINVTTETTKM